MVTSFSKTTHYLRALFMGLAIGLSAGILSAHNLLNGKTILVALVALYWFFTSLKTFIAIMTDEYWTLLDFLIMFGGAVAFLLWAL